jgi:hypothetical protein
MRLHILVYAALALGAIGLTAIIYFSGQPFFQRFIGDWNPLFAALLVSVLGFLVLSFLLSYGGFAIYRKDNRSGLVRAAGLAAVFGVIAILADFKIVYAADINIPFPGSLLFYPAIGFFAEILFHALPLALLLLALMALQKNPRRPQVVLLCIFLVALLEPVYQARWMAASGHYPDWAVAFVALHVFLINLTQLLLFRRYDFVTMLVFRMVYYLFWHIGWGYMRLYILF